MREAISKLLSTLKSKPKGVARIVPGPDGFEVQQGDTTMARVSWNDVSEIAAYKEDILTFDRVWLRFTLSTGVGSVEINEEMPGFDEIEIALASVFPGLDREWRTKVIKPAFSRNYTVIFRRG